MRYYKMLFTKLILLLKRNALRVLFITDGILMMCIACSGEQIGNLTTTNLHRDLNRDATCILQDVSPDASINGESNAVKFGELINSKSCFSAIGSGYSSGATCAVVGHERPICWGCIDGDWISTFHSPRSAPVDLEDIAKSIRIGFRGGCALNENGTVTCYGYNGALRAGCEGPMDGGCKLAGLSDIIGVDVSEIGGCAWSKEGDAWCWGDRATRVERIGPVAEVSIGYLHKCALLKDNGRVMCWGSNDGGQLGDGTTVRRTNPTEVVGVTDALTIAVGSVHSCALVRDGRVLCWGDRSLGQMGNRPILDGGNLDWNPTPYATAIPGLTGAVALEAGGTFSCAILRDRTVMCWGLNDWGQLGDGTREVRIGAVKTKGLTGRFDGSAAGEDGLSDVLELALGANHACAALGDGRVRCWGYGFGDCPHDGQGCPEMVAGVAKLRLRTRAEWERQGCRDAAR
jgi:hypothetical protein